MKKLFIMLVAAIALSVPQLAKAGYAAGTGSNSTYSRGAIGLAWNYRTSSGAVNASWAKNPGYSPYTYRWWSHRGYCCVARAFYTSSLTSWNFGYAWGYSTRNGAISKARSYTPYYSEAWLSAYN